MKCCIKCSIEKDDSEFVKDRNVCKLCRKQQDKYYNTEYRKNNRQKILQKNKCYRENNLEKIKVQRKQYREKNSEKIKKRKKEFYKNNIKKEMLKKAYYRAKQKKLPFSLEEKDIIIPLMCPILEIPIEIAIDNKHAQPNSPSLDRKIPEKGYVKGNIEVISFKANRMKSDATPEELIKLGEYAKKLLEEATKND